MVGSYMTPHLLIVDDNEMNRDMLSRRVSQQSYTFDTAQNGREALEKLGAGRFDLVLLDIMMPELDGYQTLERIKSDGGLRHIPVVMISAIDEIDSVARCIELGADDYLPKPFNPTLLKARIASSLERKRLRDLEQQHTRSLERELEIGRQIQAGFLPASLPQPAGWQLAAVFQPARMVSGDFYDAFSLPGELLCLAVADVCDKGVGAALFMALFRTLVRANAEALFSGDRAQPADALLDTISRTNDYIAGTHGDANMFATMFLGVLDTRSGHLHYVNGGNEPPILRPASGVLRRLEPTGPAVGLLPGLQFAAASAHLDPADLLLCFTDGVTEARDPANELFGDERLLELAGTRSSALEAVTSLQSALSAFTAGATPADDITILAISRV